MSGQTWLAVQKDRYNPLVPADTVSRAMVVFAVDPFLLVSQLPVGTSSIAPRWKGGT